MFNRRSDQHEWTWTKDQFFIFYFVFSLSKFETVEMHYVKSISVSFQNKQNEIQFKHNYNLKYGKSAAENNLRGAN